MFVLGIETSCDETSVSVVKNGRKVLSLETATSLAFHSKFGGVIPEIASRMQLETIAVASQAALKDAGITLKDIGLVCVTHRPGLLGSLLVGVCFAKSVSMGLAVPLLGVDHLQSHIYANFLNNAGPRLPFTALIVSGGHTSLFHIKDFNSIELIGSTRDDAAGEVFDKVAKILGFGYPGGPFIEKAARQGNSRAIKFSCSNTQDELDFSFSGIKTAVLYYYAKSKQKRNKKVLSDIAASFQESVIDALIRKSFYACQLKRTSRLVVGGGVAANGRLRELFLIRAKESGISVYFPPKELCTDNAAMVAGLGYQLFKNGHSSGLDLAAQPS